MKSSHVDTAMSKPLLQINRRDRGSVTSLLTEKRSSELVPFSPSQYGPVHYMISTQFAAIYETPQRVRQQIAKEIREANKRSMGDDHSGRDKKLAAGHV